MKIKRIVGYIICYAVILWCTWSCLMFSLEFGTDTSHLWLLNYGFSTMVDIFVKDMIKALIIAYLLMVVLPKCKEK